MSSNEEVPETEVEAGFQAMLNELKVNSRPHLTTLTILAGEYRQFAKQIVTLIENQLNKVKKYRLPIMYLIDSIIKEFPEDYVPIFSKNLVQLFADTFKVTVDQRPKLYALRTTWDDVFEPRILYDLDIKIKAIDCNWPVRVNRIKETRDSSSDEFSSDSRSDEERSKRSKINSNGRKMTEQVLTSGQTGGTIKGNDHAHTLMNHTLANTPNSTSNRSTAENSPKRKSRPPSNVGTSPRSSIDGRVHRIQSLDERVSSLSGSRNHSDASDTSFDNANLFIDEPLAIHSPHTTIQKNASRFRDFVPPNSSGRFESPSVGRSTRGSLPGSAVSSPRNSISRGVESIPIGRNKVEPTVQCKTTTRSVQTGQFTKTAETMTSVSTRDASTQKKLRRPKQVHFTQQFQPSRRTTSTQSDIKSVTSTGTQWKEKDSEIATKKDSKFSQECTFRNAIATITGSNCSRMADSILRRLHEHQKQNEFCDLTISVGADIEKVRCHKFIVAMVSDVIQSESVMKDEIIFTNIKKDILQEIIDYCYTQMIGPFVNKSHVENICDGIKKLQIRVLEPVISEIEAGLANGVDYCGAAITGWELISADIVAAAMLGQAMPQPPMSSIGLADLQENGLNNLMLTDEMESESENEETVLSDDSKDQKAILKTPVKVEVQKTTERFPKRNNSKLSKEVSCGSSSDSDEGPVDRIPAPKSVSRARPKAKPESVKVKTQSEKTPARNSRKKTAPASQPESSNETPKVPKKRKTPTDRSEGQSTPKVTVKRPRRKTNEGVDQPIKSVLDSISPTHDSPKASPRAKRQSVSKNEPEFNFEEENIQQPRITLKPLSKKILEESLNENLDAIEENEDDKTIVKDEDRVKEEPDAQDESADKSGPSGLGARRRTVAGTGTTSKEPKKEAKTPKPIRRKSIQIIPPPNANSICPWVSDEETQSLLKLRNEEGRSSFFEKTGHRLQCMFISEYIENMTKTE